MAVKSGPGWKAIPAGAIHIVLAGVALYYAVWAGEYSTFDLLRLSDQRRAEEARLSLTRSEADSLRLVVDQLTSNNRAIETVAREHFGMVRDGEILYRFVEVREPDAPAGSRP
ncbi:MAG: septum formation initiator family protein [Gemmatimonadota bacterium]|nr:septum formation initiator family protein [Gemmatimonadota bacterium]